MSKLDRWQPDASRPWDFFQLCGFVIGQLAMMPVDEFRWWRQRRVARKELRAKQDDV